MNEISESIGHEPEAEKPTRNSASDTGNTHLNSESDIGSDNSFKDLDQEEISRIVADMQYDNSDETSTEEPDPGAESTTDGAESSSDSPTDDSTLNQQEITHLVSEMNASQATSQNPSEPDDAIGSASNESVLTVSLPDDSTSGNAEDLSSPTPTETDGIDDSDNKRETADVEQMEASPRQTFDHADSDEEGDPENETDVDEVDDEADEYEDETDDEIADQSRKSRKKIVMWAIAGTIGTVVAVILGIYAWGMFKTSTPDEHKSELKSINEPPPEPAVADTKSVSDAQESQKPLPEPVIDPVRQKLATTIQTIEGLREELLIKKGEVVELKKYYQEGIEKVEGELLTEKRRLGVNSYKQAVQHHEIEMRLRTIQRRLMYINSLNRPSQWLDYGSEELLYFSRKTALEKIVYPVADHIDLNAIIKEGNGLIQKYTIGPDTLTISTQETSLPELSQIWRQALQNEKRMAIRKLVPKPKDQAAKLHSVEDHRNNTAIWADICNGDFKRKSELTMLSPEAAKCLSYCNDSDLFLNRLSDLSPKAAKNLTRWKGNWLCLNGFKSLPPDVAQYLFHWKGNWISLNNLTRLTPKTAALLLDWPGKRLELMGLDHRHLKSEGQALAKLAQWEKSGGKLYVSDQVRQLIRQVD